MVSNGYVEHDVGCVLCELIDDCERRFPDDEDSVLDYPLNARLYEVVGPHDVGGLPHGDPRANIKWLGAGWGWG